MNYLFNIGAVITSVSIAIKTILVFFCMLIRKPLTRQKGFDGSYSHFEILCGNTRKEIYEDSEGQKPTLTCIAKEQALSIKI